MNEIRAFTTVPIHPINILGSSTNTYICHNNLYFISGNFLQYVGMGVMISVVLGTQKDMKTGIPIKVIKNGMYQYYGAYGESVKLVDGLLLYEDCNES